MRDKFFEGVGRPVYMADFETRAGDKAIAERKTWVWAWAVCGIDDIDDARVGTSMETFLMFMYHLAIGREENLTVYFHNFKFDGKFLLDYFLRNGYTHVNQKKEMRAKCFRTLIDESGVFYSIDVVIGYAKANSNSRKKKPLTVSFRDSMKKLPFSVENIGKDFHTKYQKLSIDYVEDRPEGGRLTEQETEYVKNDVRVVAEALRFMYDEDLTKMTIGSDCINRYKTMYGGNKRFRETFPILDKEVDAFIRKSYRGGWCYVNPMYADRVLTAEGATYDVNSLYPSMMSSTPYKLKGKTVRNLYPWGEPVYFEGAYKKNENFPLFVQRIKVHATLKEGFFPTVLLKSGKFSITPNCYLFSTFEQGDKDLTGEAEEMELTLTSVDLEMFYEHYDIVNIKFLDGYMFRGAVGLFDTYIDEFMEQKKREKGAKRTEAKLFLNNLYGKFAQGLESTRSIPMLDEKKDALTLANKQDDEDRDPIYIPVGAFCTAYSRRFTITAAQANADVFCYADTDSIHCVKRDLVGIEVDDKDLCKWKHESDWTQARFVRAKTYIELINGEWEIKCAGMNGESKELFLQMLETGRHSVETFTYGLKVPGKKLRPVTVHGGVILVPTDFEIKRPKE